MHRMKITYFHTLYKREATDNVFDGILFKDGCAVYHSGGHGYAIPVEHIRKIESIEN